MKKVTFELRIFCTVGWNDNEDIGTLKVHTFGEVMEIVSVLKEFDKSRHQSINEDIRTAYQEIKESMETESGEEVMFVGEVLGIQCLYEDEKGIKVEMSLDNNFGVNGSAIVNNVEYENEYKRLLKESKKLATEILKL